MVPLMRHSVEGAVGHRCPGPLLHVLVLVVLVLLVLVPLTVVVVVSVLLLPMVVVKVGLGRLLQVWAAR